MRQFSQSDQLCLHLDNVLRTLFGAPRTTGRKRPDAHIDASVDVKLTDEEKKHAAGLMRVDHCGEVCAQALYQGQALTARDGHVQNTMNQAAAEENDHLSWCRDRLQELGSHTSYLDPLFYLGSFAIGATAGLLGDRWSLGFVAATEEQVVRHIEQHLRELPQSDVRSRSILETMREDEMKHATHALAAGGTPLPSPVKTTMRWMAKIMTTSTYYL